MIFLKKNLIYVLVGITVAVAFSILIAGIFFLPAGQTPQPISPSGPPIPGQGDSYQNSVEAISQAEKYRLDQDAAITRLIKNLPYQGYLFKMSYNISTNRFTIWTDKDSLALDEIEQFLKTFGVDNQYFYERSDVEYQK